MFYFCFVNEFLLIIKGIISQSWYESTYFTSMDKCIMVSNYNQLICNRSEYKLTHERPIDSWCHKWPLTESEGMHITSYRATLALILT